MNTTLFGQIPHFLKVQNMWEDDSLNILYLIPYGIKISDWKVIYWFEEEQVTIEKLTGKSIATLKKEWLNKLNVIE